MIRSFEILFRIVLFYSTISGTAAGSVITAAKPLTNVTPSADRGLTKDNAEATPGDLNQKNNSSGGGEHKANRSRPLRSAKTLRTEYDDGSLKSQQEVLVKHEGATEFHGFYKLWNREGSLIANGHYRHGLPSGRWKRVYHGVEGSRLLNKKQQDFDLPLISTFQFNDAVLCGEWRIEDASGRTVRKWNFRDGKLHGEMAVYFSTGGRMLSATYEQGVPTGTHREWTNDGNLVEALRFENGRLLADATYRWPNGNLQATGRQLQPRYRLTAQPDWWNGRLKFKSSDAIGQPQKVGEWTYYTRMGKPLQKGNYVRGEREGLFTWWYPNGQLKARGDFVAGEPHGEWTWWHVNGETQTIGDFHFGKRTGAWVRWDMAGAQQEIVQYDPMPESSPKQPAEKSPNNQQIQRRAIDIPRTADRVHLSPSGQNKATFRQ